MGSPNEDDAPHRPAWRMPDALDEILDMMDPDAQVTILANWRALDPAAREDYWRYITGPQLRRSRLKRALLIAEQLLHEEASGHIPSQNRPSS